MPFRQSLLFSGLLVLISAHASAGSAVVADLLKKYTRMSPEQIQAVMNEPIPAHAQKEVVYGFVDEDFVRVMMGFKKIQRRMDFTHSSYLQNRNPWEKLQRRYECTSVGIDDLYVNRKEERLGMSMDCAYLWTNFLVNGPELPFDMDFPLVEHVAPWSNPSQSSIELEKKLAHDYLSESDFPAFMHQDILELKIAFRKASKAFHQIKEHPRKEFKNELARIENQPAEARRFGRLVCTRAVTRVEFARTPWERQCYAYWYRYMEHHGD